MYSSTVSTTSTIPIDQKQCKSLSTSSTDIFCESLEFFSPKEKFNEKLFRNLTKPSPIVEKLKQLQDDKKKKKQFMEQLEEKYLRSYEENKIYLRNFIQEKFNKKFINITSTRLQLREKSKEKRNCVEKFLKSQHPWFVPKSKLKECPYPILDNYNYPNICIELDNNFKDYRDIIKYYSNGIQIFLINLQYNPINKIIKIWNKIEHARNILEKDLNADIVLAVGFQISERCLKTGLVKRCQKDVFIDLDSKVILTANRHFSNKCSFNVIYINFANYINQLKKNDIIRIGTKIKVKVIREYYQSLWCICIQEGLLESKMPVKIPIERTLQEIDLTVEEEEDVRFTMNLECDFILCPCPNVLKLSESLKWYSMVARHKQIMLFAKIDLNIENYEKDDIDRLMPEYTGFWLNGIENNKNTKVFQHLIYSCTLQNKSIIRSIHIESENFNYSKEIMKNTFLYADCICIPQWNKIDPSKIKLLIRKNYPKLNEDILLYYRRFFIKNLDTMEHLLLHYVATLPLLKSITCIIVCNNSSQSVVLLSKKRPQVPIIASIRDISFARNLLLYNNVIPLPYYDPVKTSWLEESKKRINCCIDYAKLKGYIKLNEPFMLLADSRQGLRYSDLCKILYIE